VHPATVTADLDALVAGAVRERRAELAALVHERVEAELTRLVGELVAAELDARRNGQRLCVECGTRPAQSGRRVCGRCRAQADARRRRERANGTDAEHEHDADDAEAP
jgi:uncharacterized paraquat-inducible protein A